MSDSTQPQARCEAADVAAQLAALGHPTRIQIVRHLGSASSCCCRDVVDKFDLAQSTVSQHLKVLVDAGLVRFAPDRQRSRYELDRAALARLSASFETLIGVCCASETA